RRSSEALMRWRRELVNDTRAVTPIGPCGQEFGVTQPIACDSCWNSRREGFHQTALYRAIRDACGALAGERTRYDELENRLLSWSYALLVRLNNFSSGYRASYRPVPHTDVLDYVDARYLGTYRKAQDPTEMAAPVGEGPDTFRAKQDDRAWHEYLRLCPA